MAFEITFTGDPGNVGSTEWRNTGTGHALVFEINKPVTVDPSKARNDDERRFLEHVITKAKTNQFYKVEEKRGPGRPRKDEGGDE